MVDVKCLVCNKEEKVFPCRAKKYKTCSKECLGKYNSITKSRKVEKECIICGETFKLKPSHADKENCCSRECSKQWRSEYYKGENNPNYGNRGELCVAWKGGRRTSNYGYVLLHMPEHPMSRPDGYLLEHRYVMSKHLGRLLTPDELVHHKDEDKQNNDISNLELTNLPDHTSYHNSLKEIVRDEKGRIKEFKRK